MNAEELLKTVDFAEVEHLLQDWSGYKIQLKVEVVIGRHGDIRFKVESQELKDQAGVMANVYESLKITDFGGGFIEDSQVYCLPLNFTFKYKVGGSNGVELFRVWYIFQTKTWTAYIAKVRETITV